MTPDHRPAAERIAEQLRHQVRVVRRRMTWWIPWVFATGLGVSIVGLIPSVAAFRQDRSQAVSLAIFALFSALFAWAVFSWLVGPFPIRPRIVPYFASELASYGGPTMTAFRRGRALFHEIAALEQLARALGVTPLATFGFAYDHYEQQVTWHPAAHGLRTVAALREAIRGEMPAARDVALDLDALAAVLRVATEKGVDFSLVLRLYAKDSMQIVCTRETRQGSFW
jgi:hypothetical protein